MLIFQVSCRYFGNELIVSVYQLKLANQNAYMTNLVFPLFEYELIQDITEELGRKLKRMDETLIYS